MEYFDKILHTYTCQHCIITGMHNNIFDGRGFAEHQLKIWGQLVKMLMTLVPRILFGSNFVYLCPTTGMRNGDEASPSIILAGRALLVKIPITLEPGVVNLVQRFFTYVF